MRGKNWSEEVQEKLGSFVGKRAETFNADSEATATMKSALYSLATIGVGVFIFKQFVIDKIPKRGRE